MKRIFLVEDDAITVEIYRNKFLREGFEVRVAPDGLAAMKELPEVRPDLVILDLMLPKFNGADVLKFIRTHPAIRHTKVVIFSNAYMTEVALAAAKTGADAALLKSSCTPAQLISVVKTLLEGGGVVEQPTPLAIADPVATAPAPAAPATAARPDKPEDTLDLARPFTLPKADDPLAASPESRARRDFLQSGPETLAGIRELCAAFAHAAEPQSRLLRLQDLHRKIHFFSDRASLAHCQRLAHLAAALEALLFELQERPKNINPATIQTIETAVALLGELCDRAAHAEEEPLTPTNLLAVLVVDDEPLSNRALVHALSRANVKPTSTASSAAALELFQNHRYDLLLLDYMMPGMNGLELYQKLRALPRYQKTPVIFVTSATEFKTQHAEILARGDDIITKPILPIELAVKSLTLLLKSRLPEKK